MPESDVEYFHLAGCKVPNTCGQNKIGRTRYKRFCLHRTDVLMITTIGTSNKVSALAAAKREIEYTQKSILRSSALEIE